jgi:hypothetical protein
VSTALGITARTGESCPESGIWEEFNRAPRFV